MNLEDVILARLARGEDLDDDTPVFSDLSKRPTVRLPRAAMVLIVEYDEAHELVELLIKRGVGGAPLDRAVSMLDKCTVDLDRVMTRVRREALAKIGS